MSDHRREKGRHKRARSPEVGQSSRRRPAPSASRDPQVAQVTQGFRTLGLTTVSQGEDQYYNLPQNLMPIYRSTPHTVPGQLSPSDQNILWDAVASGKSFHEIKESLFNNRFDISVEILENQARDIGALWGPGEDYALLHSGMTEHATEYGINHIRNNLLKENYISPIRSGKDMKARFAHLMGEGRKYNSSNPRVEGASQNQREHVSRTQPYIPAYPTANAGDQDSYPSSSQTVTVSQSPAGPSSWPTQNYDDPWTVSEPLPNKEGHGHKIGGLHYSDTELKNIKEKLAEGLTIEEVADESIPRRTASAIQYALRIRRWKQWSNEQDKHLLVLQREYGDNLSRIKENLIGEERDEDELQKRLTFLMQGGNKKLKRRPQSKFHVYSADDNNYLMLEGAKGKAHRQITRERFPHMDPSNVSRHARTINARWTNDDDQKLRDKVLEYADRGYDPDWKSIGEQWRPPRPDFAVKTRWEILRGTYKDAG